MNTAIIVESRVHPAMELVLCNFERNLPDDWKFLIIHSEGNSSFIQDIIQRNNLRRHNTFCYPEHITHHLYNQMFFSEEFYNRIDTEHFLIFQPDTLLSDLYAKDNINRYLQYDYVGAPWAYKAQDKSAVGNGGLSLRRKSKMIDILKEAKRTQPNFTDFMEDYVFSNSILTSVELHKPDFESARFFCVETIYTEKCMAIHKAWNYIQKEELETLKICFPELNELRHRQ